jgi:starch-binding outer membrane protein, SusD/RagB family
MKKILLLLILTSLSFTSCDEEFLDPTKPSQEDIFSSRLGLIGAANGLQSKWSVGRQSPGYTINTANGFTTKELGVPSAGNTNESELFTGGTGITTQNGLVNGLWSQNLIINSECKKILENINLLTLPVEKASVFTHASIFKAIALGTLIQFFEKVPLQTIENAPFNSRAEVLGEAIATLRATFPYLNDANGFSGLINTIKYKNTVYALLARYYMIAGDNDNALLYANLVNLTVKSGFTYDAVSANPIAFTAYLTTNNYQPVGVTFGLPASLAPIAADGRINFFMVTTPTLKGTGFHATVSTMVPVYTPGEMMLIKAEAYARKSLFTDSETQLNLVLQKTSTSDIWGVGANLPAYSGTLDQPSLLLEIYRNRCIELYMSGLKLEDTKRFGRPGATDVGAERNRNWYPYPDSERQNNTNTPADPTI